MSSNAPLTLKLPISAPQKPSLPSTNPSEAMEFSAQATSLKVVIVGNKAVGKTSFVRRFVAEELGVPIDQVTPTASSSSAGSLSSPSILQRHRPKLRERPPRTISTGIPQSSEVELDIYELELPTTDEPSTSENGVEAGSSGKLYRLSIWDFSGSAESLQAVQKVFYHELCMYIILWDVAGEDVYGTHHNGARSQSQKSASSSFDLGYDSDSDSSDYDYCNDCDVDIYNQEELRDAKRKLEKDIDKSVQSWIDRIQAIAPGATILPMVTQMDRLRPKSRSDLTDSSTSIVSDEIHQREVKKRCWLLKERLASNESRKVEGLKKSIRNGIDVSPVNLSRPNFLFGSVQKDGQVIPHVIATSAMDRENGEMDGIDVDNPLVSQMDHGHELDENFLSVRNFIFSSALSIASRDSGQDREEIDHENARSGERQSKPASIATTMLRDVREKLWHRSKIVQTSYFTNKFETREQSRKAMGNLQASDEDGCLETTHESTVLSALRSLHLSGELCYFGGLVPSPGLEDTAEQYLSILLLSDFVVLDPTWLVDSIDFILQYGRNFVQKTRTGWVTGTVSSGRHRATNCPTIDKEEIRRLWKSRHNTKSGLGLAEHYHQFQGNNEDSKSNNSVADQVFEFIQNLLILHDIFVPLSYQRCGSRHFFLPCLLDQKKTYGDTMIDDLSKRNLVKPVSPILEDLLHSTNLIPENENYADPQINLDSANLKEACHGYLIVDTTPKTLMERAIVHTIKSLGEFLSMEPKIEAEMLYFWKDSFRLKLIAHGGDKIRKEIIEINSVLLEAAGYGSNSRTVTCENILITYMQGSNHSENREVWRQTCGMLRKAIQNALDEIPGIEYREEGVCPHCLRMKHVSDAGTWTLSQLKSALDNKEAFIRCRHGHRTETKLNGLLHCQLVEPPSDSSIQALRQQAFSPVAGVGNLYEILSTGSKRHLIKDVTKREVNLLDAIVENSDVLLAPSLDNLSKAKRTPRLPGTTIARELLNVEKKANENDQVLNSKVTFLINKYQSKIGRVFHKKYHLNLDNCNMTDCQIPMARLDGTKLGDQLQSLSLAHNKLETLPHSLVRCLSNLRSLDLSHGLIYELPKRWNLPLLKKLDISQNLLIEFPEEVSLSQKNQRTKNYSFK